MDYRWLSNFFHGRTRQVSQQMTLDEVTQTLEAAEPVGAVLKSSSVHERLGPAEAFAKLKNYAEEGSKVSYECYEGPMDALHYIDICARNEEDCGDVLSLKMREINTQIV